MLSPLLMRTISFWTWAVGGGLPFTLLLVVAVAVWLWRRTKAVNNMGDWYCLAIALPFGLHSLLELPFAYAYFLVPVMLLVGVLEARLAATWVFSLRRWIAGCAWVVLAVAFVWSVREYIAIEEDFRVARFEAARIGHTPSEYQRPPIMLLTQLSAALEVVRIVPRPRHGQRNHRTHATCCSALSMAGNAEPLCAGAGAQR